MRPELRNGLTFGAIAAGTTLVLNLVNGLLTSGDACHRQGTPLPVVGFIVFALLAGAAGRQSSLAGRSAAMAGLVTGAVSGIAILLLVVLTIGSAAQAAAQCLQASNTEGVNVAAVASGFGLLVAAIFYLAGLGVGAGAGALGGALGSRR